MVADTLQVRRGAARFYWGWLIVASAVSIAANVGHALFIIENRQSVLTAAAAGLAIVPPLVQIAATHSISWLVRTRASGTTYRSALAMTLVVGGFAFLLSFVAIRSLATFLGFTETILGIPVAAVFPLVIDVSIGHATMCLLSLSAPGASRPDSAAESAGRAHSSVAVVEAGPAAQDHRVARVTAERVEPVPAARGADSPPDQCSVVAAGPREPGFGRALSAVPVPAEDGGAATDDVDDAALLVIAARVVEAKITTKDPGVVAKLLADRVEGYAPTVIAKRNDVHHSVVRKVLDFADPQLQAS
jgi:hypothetical protein